MPRDANRPQLTAADLAFGAFVDDLAFGAFVDDLVRQFDMMAMALQTMAAMMAQPTEASARAFRAGCHAEQLPVVNGCTDHRTKTERKAAALARSITIPLDQLLAERRAA